MHPHIDFNCGCWACERVVGHFLLGCGVGVILFVVLGSCVRVVLSILTHSASVNVFLRFPKIHDILNEHSVVLS